MELFSPEVEAKRKWEKQRKKSLTCSFLSLSLSSSSFIHSFLSQLGLMLMLMMMMMMKNCAYSSSNFHLDKKRMLTIIFPSEKCPFSLSLRWRGLKCLNTVAFLLLLPFFNSSVQNEENLIHEREKHLPTEKRRFHWASRVNQFARQDTPGCWSKWRGTNPISLDKHGLLLSNASFSLEDFHFCFSLGMRNLSFSCSFSVPVILLSLSLSVGWKRRRLIFFFFAVGRWRRDMEDHFSISWPIFDRWRTICHSSGTCSIRREIFSLSSRCSMEKVLCTENSSSLDLQENTRGKRHHRWTTSEI